MPKKVLESCCICAVLMVFYKQQKRFWKSLEIFIREMENLPDVNIQKAILKEEPSKAYD